MGKLSDQQIKEIINRATLIQKFGKSGSARYKETEEDTLAGLFEVSDDLGLERKYVWEAFHQTKGVPVHDPIVVDNNDFGSTEIRGVARGKADSELLGELKARLEYYFETEGKLTHKRSKVVWKAKPIGFSRFIASTSSPEVEFIEDDLATRIKVKQSLKTNNKFYIPSIIFSFIGFMMITGALFEANGDEAVALSVFGGLFILTSILFARFINRRKEKKKKNLMELVEVLQQSIERRFKASFIHKQEKSRSIEIPENEAIENDVEQNLKNKANS
ncbi:MAG: hypothetical protein FH748_10960 [Balneolaceae bacterium]|nr:hypothetical protein [Balneolaceae bacterium]